MQKPVNNHSKGDLVAKAMQHAMEADLIYVSDADEGFERRRVGEGFVYYFRGKRLKDQEHLARIKGLVIPPAWTDVWICRTPYGHLQATGKDARNRKQYKYHARWSSLRNETKFYRMINFGKSLPALRAKIHKDLSKPQLTQDKVVATIVQLLEQTSIRIGSQVYEKEYGSHGLTTLKDSHVKINGSTIKFSFRGKKGIMHSVDLKSKRLARVVQQCRDIPGKELFQFADADGVYHPIDSGKVNEYIKEATGSAFTAKDFRTWAGTLRALCAFKKLEEAGSEHSIRQNVLAVLDEVSRQLGNTRAVCRKYYVNPLLVTLYENNKLHAYTRAVSSDNIQATSGLSSEEQMLLKILKKHS